MRRIGSQQWLEVNYGDLPTTHARQLLAAIGYTHVYLNKLDTSKLMELVQSKIGNLIPSSGMIGKFYNGYGDVYLTKLDLDKFDTTIVSQAKPVVDGWWVIR